MLKEMAMQTQVYLVTGYSDLRKGIDASPISSQECWNWIRSADLCFFSADDAGIGSRDFYGKVTVS